MGWRKTGVLRTPEEVLVMTCDVCERDIGYEDGRRPRQQWAIRQRPPLCAPRNACGHLPPRHPTTRKDCLHEKAALARATERPVAARRAARSMTRHPAAPRRTRGFNIA